MDVTRRSHAKLLALDLLSLSTSRGCFYRGEMLVSRVETVGVVVSRSVKPGKLLFVVDDGTGCIPCVIWLNHETSPYYAKHSLPSVRVKAQLSRDFASLAQLGVVARVRGEVKGYKGSNEITVSDVVLETDPNAQLLHWVECVQLARNCYNKLSKNGV